MPGVEPIILRGKVMVEDVQKPDVDHAFDPGRQLWINQATGLPVVVEAGHARREASRYGETTLTESREGIDYAGASVLDVSRFGETTVTKSQEGVDMASAVAASRFGETQITATVEGVDAPECASGDHYAADSDLDS